MTPRVGRFAGPAAEWDALVRSSRGWTHFHLFGWKAVIEEVHGHECLYLAARERDGFLVGVLPLVRVKSMIFGHFLVSMPFVNYGGPLGSDDAIRALTAHAVALAREECVSLLELRSRMPLPLDLAVSHRKVTVLLDLPSGDSEKLWRGLGSNPRRQVRRAQKAGVTVKFGLDQLGAFHEVYAHHMRDLGTPSQPRRLFEQIAVHFPDDVSFGCAYREDRAIAGICGFRWNREFEVTWASALKDSHQYAPNMLVYWAFMERATKEGLSIFNFGRCTPGGNTHRFKLQWGSRDAQLWWYQESRTEVVGTPSPSDGAFAWGPRVWRRLPLAMAKALGPRVVRYIP